jgi:Na+/H+-dicarboxylate symporter
MTKTVAMDGLKSSLLLVLAMILGIIAGIFYKNLSFLNIIADIFLNLLLTILVPFVFFSILSAIINIPDLMQAKKLTRAVIISFLVTGFVAASLSGLVVYKMFYGVNLNLPTAVNNTTPIVHISDVIVTMFTVKEFYQLASPQHLLALVIFAILMGFAIKYADTKAGSIIAQITILDKVFMQMFTIIMRAAPLGFFAFFYQTIQQFGHDILRQYAHIIGLYYKLGVFYGTLGFSLWIMLLKGKAFILPFWRAMTPTAILSLASCSSVAAIPANIRGLKEFGTESVVADTVIPLGSLLHKTGSIMGGMFKIATALYLMHVVKISWCDGLIAILLALLVGTVMGAIPSGGMLGELLILSAYGIPNNMLMYLVAISVLIDPLATYLNVLGNSINAVFVARLYSRESD